MDITVATFKEVEEFLKKHELCKVRDHKFMVTQYDNRVALSCDWHGEEVITTVPYGLFCLHPVKCAGRGCCPRDYACSE